MARPCARHALRAAEQAHERHLARQTCHVFRLHAGARVGLDDDRLVCHRACRSGDHRHAAFGQPSKDSALPVVMQTAPCTARRQEAGGSWRSLLPDVACAAPATVQLSEASELSDAGVNPARALQLRSRPPARAACQVCARARSEARSALRLGLLYAPATGDTSAHVPATRRGLDQAANFSKKLQPPSSQGTAFGIGEVLSQPTNCEDVRGQVEVLRSRTLRVRQSQGNGYAYRKLHILPVAALSGKDGSVSWNVLSAPVRAVDGDRACV